MHSTVSVHGHAFDIVLFRSMRPRSFVSADDDAIIALSFPAHFSFRIFCTFLALAPAPGAARMTMAFLGALFSHCGARHDEYERRKAEVQQRWPARRWRNQGNERKAGKKCRPRCTVAVNFAPNKRHSYLAGATLWQRSHE